jgi:uncharacterized membrane protein
MINALRYEPRGQRQRFEPQEQDRHIHLHVHLHLTLPASLKHSMHPNAMRIVRICAALLAATVMALVAFIFALSIHDGPPDPLLSLGNLPFVLLFAGLALAWGFGCLPLLVSAWRASPHGRFRLFGLLVLLLSSSILFLLTLGLVPLVLFLVQPLITALLLMWVSREVRALSPTASPHRRLSFVVVSGLVLALLGELLWYLFAMQGGGMLSVVPLVLFAAVIVAICTLLESRKSTQARPKDASLSEVDWPQEPRGYRD